MGCFRRSTRLGIRLRRFRRSWLVSALRENGHRTTLVFPEISRGRDFPRRFEGLFDAGYIAPAGFLAPSIEVVHIPGIASLMLVNV
jgi:hypothetical protein